MLINQLSSPFKTIMKGSLIVLAGNAALYLIGFLYHIPVVRILGPERYGVWALVYSVITLVVPLASAGYEFGVVYHLSRLDLAGQRETIARVVRSSLIVVLLLSLPVAAATFLAGGFGMERIYHRPEFRQLLFLMSFLVPLIVLGTMTESVFRAFGNATAAYTAKIIPDAFKLLIIPVALWFTRGSLTVFAVLTVAAAFLPLFYGARVMQRMSLPLRDLARGGCDRGLARELFLYSWPLMLSQYVMVASKQADIFLLGYYVNESAVGVYRIAVLLSSMLFFVPTAMSYLFFPVINRLLSERRMPETLELSERTLKYMVYLNIPLVCFFALFAHNLISFVYGREFTEGANPLIFLSLAMGISIFHTLSGNILALHRETKTLLLINAAGLLVSIAANLLLVPRFALTGAAVAGFLSSLVVAILVMGRSAMLLRRFVFPWRAAAVVCAGVVVTLTAFLVRERTFALNASIFGAFLFFVLLWSILFERREYAAAWGLLKRRAGMTPAGSEQA